MAESNPPPLLTPPIDPKSRETIDDRQAEEKADVIEQLRIMPIIQIACSRIGISRSTYYRWRLEDPPFASDADGALQEGTLLMNDLAESKLIANIQDGANTAIIFWLKHHHGKYAPKPNLVLGPEKGQSNKKLVISWEDGEKIQAS